MSAYKPKVVELARYDIIDNYISWHSENAAPRRGLKVWMLKFNDRKETQSASRV